MLFDVGFLPADNSYVSIKGAKQGQFRMRIVQKGFEGKIAGLTFHYEVVSPRDVATGLQTANRQHRLIVITNERVRRRRSSLNRC